VSFAQLAIGVLGVLVINAEYSTGMIRATLSAVPKRLPVLWGKAVVFGAVAFAVSLPAVFIVFFIGQAILSGQHINIGITHPGVIRALFGAALYLTVMGLLGLGLGAIVRSTAGGIAALGGARRVRRIRRSVDRDRGLAAEPARHVNDRATRARRPRPSDTRARD
jgi:ABC-type transport system involved in multi-copper enzyme maturation permease subunit